MSSSPVPSLARRGWRFSRDGSTSTAVRDWRDPEEPESGWEIQVLCTAGHARRFNIIEWGSGLTEREASDLPPLREALEDAALLLSEWQGEDGSGA